MKTSNKRGFTLIELLVVIAIIGILSSVILASLSSARTKGRIAAAQQTLKSFSTAIAQCLGDSIAIGPTPPTLPTADVDACNPGGTLYKWPALPGAGSWSYTAWSTTLGDVFSFTAVGDGKIIVCSEEKCQTTP